MTNIGETNTLASNYSEKVVSTVSDKEELMVAFDQLTEKEKSEFYEDCKIGISPEELRQALHQKIRQLWQE